MSNMRSTGGAHRRKLAAGTSWAALALAAAALPAGAAQAQDGGTAAAETSVRIDIPAQPLGEALRRFAEQTGIQLGYSTELVAGKQSSAVSGTLSPRDALARLLAGTGLGASVSGNTATIRDVSGSVGADGELITGVVSVEGYLGSPYFGGAGQAAGVNGINGSRDITATEGTGSLTSGALTIGSKVPQALKDVPQSVSVLTSELLEQRNVTDFTTAMKQLPGVTVVQGDSGYENTFYSRGFMVQSFQIDGGAPLITGTSTIGNIGYFPQIDMAQYDHVELLRGANGTFNGYGSPGGTVNLVRKKPLDHGQVAVEAQLGSWNNYRFVIDATSPLALDGKLRGRVVMTYQDNDYFYDLAHDNKTLVYGIAELDLTPSTLVTAGMSHSRQNSRPGWEGLPRYQNGDDLELPRSTSFVFPWNRWTFDTTEIFGALEQKIGADWTAKINFTHNRQNSHRKMGEYTIGGVNPYTNAGPTFGGRMDDYGTRQWTVDTTLAGSFSLFGSRQEIVLGFNHANSDGGGNLGHEALVSTYMNPYRPYPGGPVYCEDYGAGVCPPGSIGGGGPPIDVFDFDPYDPLYSEPQDTLPYVRYNAMGQLQTSAYLALRLTAFDRLHLNTSVRWNKYENRYDQDYLCTSIPDTDPGYSPSCFGRAIGDVYQNTVQNYKDDQFSWPPTASLSYDLTRELTAYVGYSDIYQTQGSYRTADGGPIDPITGGNYEAGLKWAPHDGRLNLSLAAYRIERRGFARVDPAYPPYQEIEPGVYCCFLLRSNQTQRSQGLDIEATGELMPGLQVAASYTFSENTQEGEYYGDNEGTPFRSIQPKHLYKFWVSYDFGARGGSGPLSGLSISGGLNGQSSAYYSGMVCVNLNPPDPLTGASECKSYGEPDYVAYEFVVPGYAAASARIDYRFSERFSLAVNFDNIFDKTYYSGVGQDVGYGNWYGAPRSVTATLRAKW